jgi:hypothetical protein
MPTQAKPFCSGSCCKASSVGLASVHVAPAADDDDSNVGASAVSMWLILLLYM